MIPQKTSKRSERVRLTVVGLAGRGVVTVRAAAPMLLVTIESSVARASTRGLDLTLDRSGCLLLPRGSDVALCVSGVAAKVAAFAFQEPLFALVARTYGKVGVDRRRLDRWTLRLELLPRTVWIHEIVHRYVFEREALGEDDNLVTRFLEAEILKEIYFLFRDREAGADRATIVRANSACVERAIAYVDAHLLEPCDVAALAAHARASESTLLRAFHREIGASPAAYWRNRKLDVALILLRGGRHSVAEVAVQAGYDNPTAFGFAFRKRFGRAPSSFKPRRPLRPAP
jgi:AraC-like DNA-binding protein